MDITWYGHSCFRITERGEITVVTDPYGADIGLPMPKLKGDIVTVSHQAHGHDNIDAVKGHSHVLGGAGEYEFGGVFIYGVPLHHVDGEEAHYNIGYVINYGGITVAHLGDLTHVPDQATIEAMGEVNVALVPVGGGMALKASAAAEVIGMIEPNYIVPMHYALPGLSMELEPVDKFLQEMGASRVQEEEYLRVTATGMPEQPQVVVLTPNL